MWPDLAVAFLMMVVSEALRAVGMAPKAPPQAPEPGKLDVPTAEEGKPIPVIFGTCLVKSPNVIWYGDAATTPIKQGGGSAGKKG